MSNSLSQVGREPNRGVAAQVGAVVRGERERIVDLDPYAAGALELRSELGFIKSRLGVFEISQFPGHRGPKRKDLDARARPCSRLPHEARLNFG